MAVIPCFNEARGIAALVREVRKYVRDVMVVDDGSHDSTDIAARAGGAKVLRHERNRGKGAAINTGLSAAVGFGFQRAVLLDGDGQHAPDDIPGLLSRSEETGAALVIGNRMLHFDAMPLVRRWVNRWMSREISRIAGTLMPDSQCGFRVIDLRAWRSLNFRSEHFEIESEMAIVFARSGHRVDVAPVKIVAGNRRSHIRPLRDTWRWFKWRRELTRRAAAPPAWLPLKSQSAALCR